MTARTSPHDPVADRHLEVIERIGHDLSLQPDVDRVVLFGSRAIGDAGSRSDIDLAIEAPTADVLRRAEIEERVERAPTLLMIDIVWLDAAPAALRERIERQGRVLFDRAAA